MKKLMVALAAVAMAAVSQAASIKWQGTMNGVDPTAVTDNGNYAASTALAATDLWSYTLKIFSADGQTTIATKSSTSAGPSISVTLNNTNIKLSTDYTYEIVISASEAALKSKVSPDYDYSAAALSTTITGSFSTIAQGTSPLDASPTSWTVSGITAIPEPTSGLLLLLGVAGLALKRKRA